MEYRFGEPADVSVRVDPVSPGAPKEMSQRRLQALVEMAENGTGPERDNARRKLAEAGYDPKGKPLKPTPSATTPTSKPTAVISSSEDAIDHAAKDASKAVADTTKKASGTTKRITDSLDMAKNAVKGHTNARNLLFAAAASVVGVGIYQRNRQTRIEPDEQYYDR